MTIKDQKNSKNLYKCRRCHTYWVGSFEQPRSFTLATAYQKPCGACTFGPATSLDPVTDDPFFPLGRGVYALEPMLPIVRVLGALAALLEAGKAVGRVFWPDAAVFAPTER